MPDVASLSLSVTTDAGDSVAQLAAVASAGDRAATSLGGVAEAAGKVGPSASSLASSFQAGAASMAGLSESSRASAAGIMAVGTALGTGAQAFGQYGSASVEAVQQGAMMVAHLDRLGVALAAGGVNARETYAAIRILGEAFQAADNPASTLGSTLGSVSSAIGISNVAMLGIAGAAAAAVAGILYLAGSAEKLDNAISNLSAGVDKGMGLTVAGFRSATEAAGQAAGITTAAAEAIGESLAKAGVMGDAGMQQAIVSIEKFSALTGTTAPEATKLYANALKDPIAGLETLNNTYQITDQAEAERIGSLVAMGDAVGAAKAIQNDYNEAVARGVVTIGVWTQITNTVGNGLSALGEEASTDLGWLGEVIEKAHDAAAAAMTYKAEVGSIREEQDLLKASAIDAGTAINAAIGQEAAEKAKAMNAAVAAATQAYGKQYDELNKVSGEVAAFQALQATGQTLTAKQTAAYGEASEALDKLTTHVTAQKTALAELAGDDRFLDEVTKSYENLAQKQEMAASAAQPLIEAANAQAAVLDKAAAATQGLANARAFLTSAQRETIVANQALLSVYNSLISAEQKLADAQAMLTSPLRGVIESYTAAAKVANDYLGASQHLADSQAALRSPMTEATNALDAQASAIDKYLSAAKALANAEAEFTSPLRAATEAMNAHAASLNKAIEAAQAYATAVDWMNSPVRDQTEATTAAASVINDYTAASQALANAQAALDSPLTDATNQIEAQTDSINKYLTAAKNLASAQNWLNSSLRPATEEMNAQTAAIRRYTDASQALVTALVWLDSPLRKETEDMVAATAAVTKYTDAKQAAVTATAELESPLRGATQSLLAEANAANALMAAQQGLANAHELVNSGIADQIKTLKAETAAVNGDTNAWNSNAAARRSASSSSFVTASPGDSATVGGEVNWGSGQSYGSGGYTGTTGAYAKGGEFIVHGEPGIDTNLVAMWLTDGEKVTIKPVGSFAGGGEYMRDAGGYWSNPSGRINNVAAAGQTTAELMTEEGFYYVSDPQPTSSSSSSSNDAITAAQTLATAMQSAAQTLATAQQSAADSYAASIASAQATEITALQAIAKPTEPTAPNYSSAGATVAQQPGAYGSDKNPSTFYDPSSRTAYMAQFGIQGDEATQKATQAYELQEQQYRTDLADYQTAQATLAQLGAVGADVTTGLDKVATIIKTASDAQIAATVTQAAALAAAETAFMSAAKSAHTTAASSSGSASSAATTAWPGTATSLYQLGNGQGDPGLTYVPGGIITGAADGGSFIVRGSPGRDTNLVNLALTAGELVSIKTPAQQKALAPNSFNIVINTPDAQSFHKARGSVVARMSQMVQAATRNRASAS